MKTILYQPLFINPQAYFVFPQLYHIEKGDSYIEPANITGQLIINNLSEGLTLTPTVNVIQDSNQIDFSLFKGKHIRISQYTNIGAVVLGEWYIPGAPEYTNTAGKGNVYLMIGDKQYDAISGQLQTYSVSGSVKLEFLNMEEINNFAGTIKFTNVN